MIDMELAYFVAHDARGRIIRTGQVPRYAVAAQQFDAAGVLEGKASDDKNYVDVATGTIHLKTDSPIVMSGDIFTNVPPDSWAEIEGRTYPITDTTAEFTFSFPGVYHVTIYSVRYLPLTHTITV